MLRSYCERREAIYSPLREKGTFTWDTMYQQEYALASIHHVSSAFRKEIAFATEKLGQIFARTTQVVQHSSDELLKELGIPLEVRQAVRFTILPELPTIIGRFDFAHTPEGLKMLEFNSDTPTGIVESFYVNGKACEFFGYLDPNQHLNQHFAVAFQRLISEYQKMGMPTDSIFFSSLDWHEEDAGTTKYLMEQSGLSASFIPLSSLAIHGDQLFALDPQRGNIPIDLLYRLHALEILADESDLDGYPTGAHVLQLVAKKKLALINPPSAFLSQTKAMQALIWSLHETGMFFTEEEHSIIRTYMLPTYLENPFHGKISYVRKPIFGREGGAVTLFERDGRVIEQDIEDQYWDQMMIYQQLAPLENVEVETKRGIYQGKLLWGSFLIGGQASAIIARVDHNITGNLSYFLPIGLNQ
ncbi:glutathionylspermidine synthase family protein [Hazenella coriacea]|uniref:Glutathionylspermidine synthase n=1 Tax=Hazenella coriacea TaxID=1179467 RepID=A0A4R3L7C0_9BACL|nr:glutathionylspermidine synthase family protein [Hazenella coriacea]TCS95663.1 glutathionylspermidine synthase [Hazenella coriacea]